MADEAKNEETKTPAKKTSAPKTVDKSGVATYNQEEAETITVQTTGEFQLYDPVTQTLFPANIKNAKNSDSEVEVLANNRFVVSNIERGKLKKVS